MTSRLLGLFIALFTLMGCDTKEAPPISKPTQPIEVPTRTQNDAMLQKELASLDSDAYVEAYIVKVINEGSNGSLGFSGGAMDAGIAAKEDALNIARFTMSLSKRKSSDDEAGRKSELFYTSNCGGCHGNDGKGLGGAFPDLTKRTFIGIEKRKTTLLSLLKTSSSSH